MIKFNDIVAREIERTEDYYLTELEVGDLIHYYWPSIDRAIADLRIRATWDTEEPVYSDGYFPSLDADQSERVQEYLYDNAADLLSIGYGYHIVPGYFALASCEEIEIDLSHWINLERLTPARIETIERYSDIGAISDRFGYVVANFHLDIELRLNEIDAILRSAE